jgi:hypothetical protein
MKKFIITGTLCLLSLMGVKASNPGWTVNPYAYQYSMTATGVLVIDHAESTDTADIVGAFVGSDCRGFAKPIFVLSLGRYIAFLMIYSDLAGGENISFKMYDSSGDTVVNAMQIISFVPNNTVGLLTSPYIWSNTGLSHNANIISFSLPQQISPAVIDTSALTIHVTVTHNTNVTALVASFALSPFATARVGTTAQQSGITANNFTNPVVYTISAEDPAYTKNWTVIINVLPVFNTGTDFLSFSFPQQNGPAVIDTLNHTVNIEVVTGTALNNLVAGFTLSPGAVAKIGGIVQLSNVTNNDFTNPIIYHVVAEDTSITQNWSITVTATPPLYHGTDILTYSFPEQTGAAAIDTLNHIVNIHVATGTEMDSLTASFALSPGATAKVNGTVQQSGITMNSFIYPVIYEIKAEDSTLQNWIVMVDDDNVVDENLFQNAVLVFPNPTRGLLHITSMNDAQIIVYDITGKVVLSSSLNLIENTCDLSAFQYGAYILKLVTGNEEVNFKIIKR